MTGKAGERPRAISLTRGVATRADVVEMVDTVALGAIGRMRFSRLARAGSIPVVRTTSLYQSDSAGKPSLPDDYHFPVGAA